MVKKLFCAALLAACTPLAAMESKYGFCEIGGAGFMFSYPLCQVTVYLTGTLTKASIFSDNMGTVLSNPFTATNTSYWQFYTADGHYDVQISGAGIVGAFTYKNLQFSSAAGGVSSVGLSLPAIFNVSGSPVTGAGVLTATLATQSAGTFFAGPSAGSPVAPTFRAMQLTDLPSVAALSLYGNSTGSSAPPTAIAFSRFLQSANNLNDVGSVSAARTSLGLGTAAVQNTGTSGANLPFLNGTNTWANAQTFTVAPTVTAFAGGGVQCVEVTNAGLLQVAPCGSGGTVTTFSAGAASPLFTTSVATATTTPALSFSLTSASANRVFASPNGSSGAGSYRALVLADLPAGAASIAAVQANLGFCNSTTGSGSAYTCSFVYSGSLALTAYTTGQFVILRADTSNTGAVTLNIDSLGIKSIKQKDGTTDPTSSAITAGQFYVLFYDGTVFRMQ